MTRIVFGMIAAIAASAFAAPAMAQSVGGVSGSDVKAGEDLFEYRFAYSPEYDGHEEAFTHRLHYQHGFSDSFRLRGLAQFNRRDNESLQPISGSVELLYQFAESEKTGGWDSAIRLDGYFPLEHNVPGRARIGWHNQFALSHDVELRGVLLLGHQFGDLAKPGMIIETREEATYQFADGFRIGAQMFNNMNTTSHFGGWNEQTHQVGPVLKGHLGKHTKFEFSTLFGISHKASDADLRFFISYAL